MKRTGTRNIFFLLGLTVISLTFISPAYYPHIELLLVQRLFYTFVGSYKRSFSLPPFNFMSAFHTSNNKKDVAKIKLSI